MSFERHFDYLTNFSKLDAFIPKVQDQQRYYENLRRQCAGVMKNASNIDIAVWDLRIQKSLKQIFTSASFYIESKFALKNHCATSYYFLSYYALFHAFSSVLYLDPVIEIGKMIEMPHEKVKNNFIGNYAKGNRQLIDQKIEMEFQTLRFYREYYSYSMPFNAFFGKVDELAKPQDFLEGRLIHCYQIATLLSNVWEQAFDKYGRNKEKLIVEDWEKIEDWFYKMFCKRHPVYRDKEYDPSSAPYVVEFTDKVIFSELKAAKSGHLNSFSILLDHSIDEFNTYANDDGFEYPFAHEITTFVYNAIS